MVVNLKELVPIFWFQFIYLAFKLETGGQKLVISQSLTMIRSRINDTIRIVRGILVIWFPPEMGIVVMGSHCTRLNNE
jgi:hypothetical protein